MNKLYSDWVLTRIIGLLCALVLSGSVAAQFPNPDAAILFSRASVSGTAASAGAGGAFSSVGADLGCIDLNPAGLGLYKTSDLCITPGLKISADRSAYDGNTMNGSQVSPVIAQGGGVYTKKYAKDKGLKSISLAINFEGGNFFSRNQNFSDYNTTNTLVSNYAQYYNKGYSPAATLDALLLYSANILGYNPTTGVFSSNINTPVTQSGYMDTRGFAGKVSLGFGANISDKLYVGFSVAVPILNYTVNTQMTETNPVDTGANSQFQYYTLNPSVNEFGAGFTGNLGLIYQPASWVRVGISYGLPTWLFMNENYNSSISASFDSTGYEYIPTQYNPPFTYRLRLPMKGVAGASFYFAENSFFSADYEIQNMGATHYSVPNDSFQIAPYYNSYMKTTYGFVHTIKAGIQGAYRKLRIRAGYSYITSPFKSGQNFNTQFSSSSYNESVQTGTFGLGLAFKAFYIDMAYVFTYTKDGLSQNFQSLQVPLDEIHSIYMTHSVLLTVGIRLGSKSDKSSAPKQQRRSSDQLPRYIDPGDKY